MSRRISHAGGASRLLRGIQALSAAIVCGAAGWGLTRWMEYRDIARFLRLNGDYGFDADPALKAALHGHIFSMFATKPQPLMLPFALLARVPALLVGQWLGLNGGHQPVNSRYVVGCVGALLIGAWVVAWAAGRGRGWRGWIAGTLLGLAVISNPLAVSAMEWGHVEEVLGAAVLVAALVSFGRERWGAAVVLAALAGATKQPFLLALPAMFFMLPTERRFKHAAAGVALLATIILVFVGPHLGGLLSSNAAVATSGGSSGYDINVFNALGLLSIAHLGKILIVALALGLPVLVAWRSGWRLTTAQGFAVIAIVLLWRCLLDQFNLGYYMTPAAGALIALDWLVWERGRHPLQRIGVLSRLDVFLPVLGFAAAALLYATVNGSVISQTWQNVFGDVNGKDYLIDMLIATALLIPVALAVPIMLTRSRKHLYGGALAAAVALIAGSQIIGGGSKQFNLVPTAPGFASVVPGVLAEQPPASYWLGRQPEESFYMTLAARSVHSNSHIRSLLIYGNVHSAYDVILYNRRPIASRDAADRKLIRECEASACPKHVSLVQTAAGPGLIALHPDSVLNWQAVVPTSEGSVLLLSTLKIDPRQVLSHLTKLTLG